MKKLLLGSMILAAMSLTACSGGKAATSKSMNQGSVGSPHIIFGNVKSQLEQDAQRNHTTLNDYGITIAGKSYPKAHNVDLRAFGQGFSQHPYTGFAKYTDKTSGTSMQMQRKGMMYLFQQQHSAVALLEEHEFHIKTGANQEPQVVKHDNNDGDMDLFFAGTPTATVPTAGSYHYQGTSHLQHGFGEHGHWHKGKFDYTIDFANKTGKGQITEGNTVISLKEAPITKFQAYNPDGATFNSIGVKQGVAQVGNSHGEYGLGLFGANADEVIGFVGVGDYAGIMGGTKK